MHINVTLLLMYHVPPGGGAEFPFTYSLLVPVMPCVRALQCARQVMSEWSDLVMAFGQSDEFSFLLPASSPLYGRRSAKLSTSFVSLFSSRYPGCYIGNISTRARRLCVGCCGWPMRNMWPVIFSHSTVCVCGDCDAWAAVIDA